MDYVPNFQVLKLFQVVCFDCISMSPQGGWGVLACAGGGDEVFRGCNVTPVRCSSWGVLVCVFSLGGVGGRGAIETVGDVTYL